MSDSLFSLVLTRRFWLAGNVVFFGSLGWRLLLLDWLGSDLAFWIAGGCWTLLVSLWWAFGRGGPVASAAVNDAAFLRASVCMYCDRPHLFAPVISKPSGRAPRVELQWAERVQCYCGTWVEIERRTQVPKRRDCRFVSAASLECPGCGWLLWVAWFVRGGQRDRCAGVRLVNTLPIWRLRFVEALGRRAGLRVRHP